MAGLLLVVGVGGMVLAVGLFLASRESAAAALFLLALGTALWGARLASTVLLT